MFTSLSKKLVDWLTHERPSHEIPLCDFEKIRYEIRPCDVLLIEGRSRVSEVIKQITQSPWSHSCLYIGRLHDIDDPNLRAKIQDYFQGDPDIQLVIEGYLGKGTILSPLNNYSIDNIRICRPRGLSRPDAQKVINYSLNQLGKSYDVRQFIDLGRFILPWGILPRRWRSSLFEHHITESTKTVCSTLIAEAFASIDFPILPVVKPHEKTGIELYARNPKLFTPSDFDYSPYFDIIKHPFVSYDSPYRDNLPWNREGLISIDGKNIAQKPSQTSLSTPIEPIDSLSTRILEILRIKKKKKLKNFS